MATDSPLLLALDAGSPLVSVAAGRAGEAAAGRPPAERSVEIGRSSGLLLALISEVLEEAGARPADLGGIVALRGPGSFTGLRVGLATALGLHQALEVPVVVLPTLLALAARAGVEAGGPGAVIAAVDALRGEWSAQAFTAEPFPSPLGGMELVSGGVLPLLCPETPGLRIVTGFGVSRLAELPGWPEEIRRVEAGPLAATALRLAARLPPASPLRDPALLVQPLYARPPAVTPPKRRPVAPPPGGPA